jgi:ABC transporter substrate binding protein
MRTAARIVLLGLSSALVNCLVGCATQPAMSWFRADGKPVVPIQFEADEANCRDEVQSGGPASALAAKSATTTIPIVFANGTDPVELGLVGSLNRPGGNITGVTFLVQTVLAKRLELLHKIATAVASIGLLVNPTGPQAALDTTEAEAAAGVLGVRLVVDNASTPTEIEAAFARFNEQRVGAVIVGGDPFFSSKASNLPNLRPVLGCPRSIRSASMSRLAV